jgi:hypothetical protein
MRASFLLPAISLLFSGFQTSCEVQNLTPRPQPRPDESFQQTLKSLVVGIVPGDSVKNQSTANYLKRTLTSSGLFKQVALTSELKESPDLVLESYAGSDIRIPFNEPLLYVLTLGVIPATFELQQSFSFTLRSPKGKTVKFSSPRFKERSVMGWVALPMALSPDWERSDNWQQNPTLTRNMWLTILEPKKREIFSLLR